jgi:uncharacterized membrane protein YbhN (UPF0104 family)
MRMTSDARRLLRLAGLTISTIAVVWIGFRFARSGALDLITRVPGSGLSLILAILGAGVVYALALTVLALSWWRLTAGLAGSNPPWRPIIATYAVSQYGKYLPGNVAHYALRHAWSRRYGFSHSSLGVASVVEAALLLVAALGLTLLADTRHLGRFSMIDPRVAIALLVGLVAMLGVALQFARRRPGLAHWQVPTLPPTGVIVLCFGCCIAFFIAGAGLLEVLAYPLGIGIDSFAMLLAASAASWAAGFIVIGAPGGLGVREAAFVALAGGALGESQALLLIGLFRMVTFLGDTLFFADGALALRGAGDPTQTRSDP